MYRFRAFWKWFLSWFKNEWGPNDYPLRYREQGSESEIFRVGRTVPRWSLQVINWWQIGGIGDTREEAFSDFKASLAAVRESGKKLPRPGTGLPIEFASAKIIERHQNLAREFFREILNLDYDECFISDESSLYDFAASEAEAIELASRIESCFQIKLHDREKLLVSRILENIAESRMNGRGHS